jgi:hypothetical protein
MELHEGLGKKLKGRKQLKRGIESQYNPTYTYNTMRRHHLDYVVYIRPRNLDLWKHDANEFFQVVESLYPMATASYAEYAILFEGSDEQRAYSRCIVGYDVDGSEIKVTIEMYGTEKCLCLTPKFGITDSQLRIVIKAFENYGHTVIASKGFHIWRYGYKKLHPDFVEKIEKVKTDIVSTEAPVPSHESQTICVYKLL